MTFKFISNKNELIRVWFSSFDDDFVLVIEEDKEYKEYKRTVRKDDNGKFFTWNKEKFYLNNYHFFTWKELKARLMNKN